MTVYGVLADIHGNLEALGAVIAALERRGVDRIVCLGDIVGYNANSNECVEMVKRVPIESVAGNHDLISLGRLGLEKCSDKAAYALRRTRKTLTPASREYLRTLEPARIYEGRFLMQHAGLGNVQQYIRSARQVGETAEALRRAHPGIMACFFGHTHDPKIYEVGSGGVEEIENALEHPLAADKVTFVNPGSVDASRKREHKMAEFAVFDSAALRVELHRAPYDDRAVEEKAARGGYRIGRLARPIYAARRRIRSALRR
jgi:predicted phosphodiesterase